MKKLAFVLLFFALYGCSYNFVGQSNSLPGGIKRLFIANIVNSTTEPNLHVYLKNDLVSTFNLDRRVTVVGEEDQANGVLKVEVTNYSVDPISYSLSGFANRYRCAIVVKLKLLNSEGKVVENKTLESYRDFNAKNDVDATEKARESISKDVLKDLSLKIRDALFVNF